MGRIELPGPLRRLAGGSGRKLLLRLGVSALVLVLVLLVVDVQGARQAMSRLRPLPWIVTLAGFLALQSLSALKWRYLVGLAGAHLPRRHALTCHAAGLFANLCLPSLVGGDVLRAALALPATHRRTALVVASVADRVADVTALLALAVAGLAVLPAARGSVAGTRAILVVAGALALLGLGATFGLALVLRRRPLRTLPRKVAKRLIEGIRAARTLRARPGAAALGFAACVAIQAGFVLVNVQLGASLGLDMPVALWFLLWPLAKIAAMVPLGFGGLGVREAAFAALVSPFADSSLAVAQSLVWQSVLIVGGVLAGVFWIVSPVPSTGNPT